MIGNRKLLDVVMTSIMFCVNVKPGQNGRNLFPVSANWLKFECDVEVELGSWAETPFISHVKVFVILY